MLGHVCLVRGFAVTDASLAMTFEFTKLPFAVGIAYLAFGEIPDRFTWLGGTLVFASVLYIAYRGRRLAPSPPPRRGPMPSERC